MKAKAFLGELLGTYILVLIGTGSVAMSALWGWFELWQIALIWVGGVSLAIYASRKLSGAHLNPAVSIGLLIAGRENLSSSFFLKILGQFLGAFLAAVSIYLLFSADFPMPEDSIISGTYSSQESAAMFGEFYPNPGFLDLNVSTSFAMLVEGFGTFVLMLVILFVPGQKRTQLIDPILIGLTVGVLIFFLAPYTQGGFNPARDFSPRLFAYVTDWGPNALANGWGNSILVYVLAPILGAGLASGVKLVLPNRNS